MLSMALLRGFEMKGLFFSLFVLSPMLVTNAAWAGTLTATSINSATEKKVVITYVNEVTAGDREKLTQLLPADVADVELHLNSLGGSFDEAIAIAKVVWSKGITTVVDINAECYSACAIIFMAGREAEYEGSAASSRRLHVKGKLGFHPPYLPSAGCVGTCAPPPETYRRGILAIADLLAGTTSSKWPATLVAEMLRKSPDDLLQIETVDQAGRWRIELFGGRSVARLDHQAAFTSCLNGLRWSDDDQYDHFRLSEYHRSDSAVSVEKKRKSIPAIADEPARKGHVYSVSVEVMTGSGCRITEVGGELSIALEIEGMQDYPLPGWKTLHPSTRIASLAPR